MPIYYTGGQILFCGGMVAYHQSCCDADTITQPGCGTVGDIVIPPSFQLSLSSPVGTDGIAYTGCHECDELQSQTWTAELLSYGPSFVNYESEIGPQLCGVAPPTSAKAAVQFTFCGGPLGNQVIGLRMGFLIQYAGQSARHVGNLFGNAITRPDTAPNRVLTSWSGQTVTQINGVDGICTPLFMPTNQFLLTLI